MTDTAPTTPNGGATAQRLSALEARVRRLEEGREADRALARSEHVATIQALGDLRAEQREALAELRGRVLALCGGVGVLASGVTAAVLRAVGS